MNTVGMYDVIIIGGGLAGLTCALHLSKSNLKLLLIEKNEYPHHKVCGEYVSNEVMPYLRSLGINPFIKGAVEISKFEISNQKGKKISTRLPLGGFGISRYSLDHFIHSKLPENTSTIFSTVEKITFKTDSFEVSTLTKDCYHAKFVVGAFGKRSSLDSFLNRPFMRQKSPWLGIKAHYEYDFPTDTVALHNFHGGYCGLSKIETGAVNACYLTTYNSFKQAHGIEEFQKGVMSQNPHLADFFSNSKLVFDKPLSISQISFEKKDPVEEHVFMIGDSAGLIHPLCGNGMAMAIHSAKLCAEVLLEHFEHGVLRRDQLERTYEVIWKETFSKRLQAGRLIQNLLLNPRTANLGLGVAQLFPSLVPKIIQKTHGELLS